MKLILVGQPPMASEIFDFETEVGHSKLNSETELTHLPGSSISLPWRLRKIFDSAGSEKVVVHADSARSLMAAAEARQLARSSDNIYLVYTIEPALEASDLAHAARYARGADRVMVTSAEVMQRLATLWDTDTLARTERLEAPAVAPTADMPAGADSPLLLYQGEITRHSALEAAVRAVGQRHDLRLLVAGTGKGRWAMPAVKLSRTLCPDRVIWDGPEHRSTVMRLTGSTWVLAPELQLPTTQVVCASYAAQGASVIASCTTPEEILAALSQQPAPAQQPPTVEGFFDGLLALYRGL